MNEEYNNEKEQSATLLELYRCDKLLGYGEKPGIFTVDRLKRWYNDVLVLLRDYEIDPHKEQLRQRVHALCMFQIAEFEVAYQSLATHFLPDIFRGMTKKKFHSLFLRYSSQRPETIWAREERENALERLVSCKIVRKEWFSQKPLPDQNSSIATS
ncbi:hypothetical protein HY483_01975 [Candidatus Woesearchaeota archaeon]|nr:hypothetical protein [Candidatus Woesearchaeota archaeon]